MAATEAADRRFPATHPGVCPCAFKTAVCHARLTFLTLLARHTNDEFIGLVFLPGSAEFPDADVAMACLHDVDLSLRC